MRRSVALTTLGFALACVPLAFAQGPTQLIPHAQDRPPNPPKSPSEAVQAMTVPPGFTIEVVASEPNLVNPVAMTFDERGRVWVTESLEYPRREAGPGRDRVKVLEDTDGDGAADRFTIFAEGLNIPSGIAVGHGGVWVANAPDILFYPDSDRDAKPDGPPQVVVTGFGRDDTHELPNSLTWGPDGWLYGWNGVFNRSRVTDKQGRTHDFTCAIFRVHPRTRDFEIWCEGTSNPWGIAINDNGDFFASACVIDHLWHLTETGYYIRQGGPYPPHTWPIGSIVDHKHQKAAYCGIHWFDSPAYPPEYRGKLFMGNIHGNCINVDALERNGSTYTGKPTPDFLTAHDSWFMPVVQKTGPDGCLYVLDWYDRYHCYQDANRDPAGIDRLKGRLYRVRYKDTPRRTGFDLATASDAKLIESLGAANVYDRDIAQRLLTERLVRQEATATNLRTALESIVLDESQPRIRRLHALWARAGATERRLDGEFLSRLLENASPTLRAWGVRLAGNQRAVDAPVAGLLDRLSGDPSPEVRLQLAIALPKLRSAGSIAGLIEVLSASEADPLIPQIVYENLKRQLGATEFAQLEGFIRDAHAERSPALARFWPRILEIAVADDRVPGSTLASLFRFGLGLDPATGPQRLLIDTLTRQVRDGAVRDRRLESLRQELAALLQRRLSDGDDPVGVDFVELAASWGDPAAVERLRRVLTDPSAHPGARFEALDLLARRGNPALLDTLTKLLDDRDGPEELRGRVLAALNRFDGPRVAELVLDRYGAMSPALKASAIALLTERPTWAKALLDAVEAKSIPAAAVNVNQLRRLQSMKDPAITSRARAIWGTVREGRDPQRELVVGQMRNFLQKTPGDPISGRGVFVKLCAQCHKIHGEGQDVGPDITLNGRNDFDQLLSNVFDPNLVIGEAYQATVIATKDGRVLTGLLAEDSPEGVSLKVQGGKVETVPRGEVEAKRTSEVSFMPEDVEKQLTPQEIADLFAFLVLDKPPEDKTARRLPGSPRP